MKSVNSKWVRSSESSRQQIGKTIDLFAADATENLEIPSVDSARTLKSISSVAPLKCPNWSPKFSHNLSGEFGTDEEYTVRSSVSSVKLLSCPPWQPKFASLVGRDLSPASTCRAEDYLLKDVTLIEPISSDVLAASQFENRNEVNFSFRSALHGLPENGEGKYFSINDGNNNAGQLLRRRESLRSRLNNISGSTKWRGSAASSAGSDAPVRLPLRTGEHPLFGRPAVPDPKGEDGRSEKQYIITSDNAYSSSYGNPLVDGGKVWSDNYSTGDPGRRSQSNIGRVARRDSQVVTSGKENRRGVPVMPRLTTRETAASITECDDDYYSLSDAQSLNQCRTNRDADTRKISEQQFQRDQAAGQEALRNAVKSTSAFPSGKYLRLDFLAPDTDLNLSMDKHDTSESSCELFLLRDKFAKGTLSTDTTHNSISDHMHRDLHRTHNTSTEISGRSDFRPRGIREVDKNKAWSADVHLGMSKSVRGKSDIRYAASSSDLYRSVFFAELASAIQRRGPGQPSLEQSRNDSVGLYPFEIADVPPIRVETRWGALSLDSSGSLSLVVKRVKPDPPESIVVHNDGDNDVGCRFVVSLNRSFRYEINRCREGSQQGKMTSSVAEPDVALAPTGVVELSSYDSARKLPPYLKRKLEYMTSMANYFRSASPRIIISDSTGIFSLFWKSNSETRRANLSKSLYRSTCGGSTSDTVDTEFRAELNHTIFSSVRSVAFCSGQVSICSRDEPPRVVDVKEHIMFSLRENSKTLLLMDDGKAGSPLLAFREKLGKANLSIESVLQAWNVAFSRYVRCLKFDIKAREIVNRRLRCLLVENSNIKCAPRDPQVDGSAGLQLPEPPKDFKQIWRQAYLHVMPVIVLN